MKLNPDQIPGRTIKSAEKELLYFSGTSYLGIGRNSHFNSRLNHHLSNFGSIFSSSRNNTVQLDIYENFEKEISIINESEAALSVSSGLLAGQLVVRYLEQYTFINAPNCHPAIWKNKNFKSDFDSYIDLIYGIGDKIQSCSGECVVCCNGIDPLTCEPFGFDWIKDLTSEFPVWLVIDDSHAIGLVEKHTLESHYKSIRKNCPKNVKLIIVASLAKALGLPTGIILSDADVINEIRNLPFFIGASPSVPAYLLTFLDLQEEYASLKTKINQNIQLFNSLMSEKLSHFRYLADYPVYYFPEEWLFHSLINEGIYISCFSYPNPEDKPVCRIVLNALHEEKDIILLVEKLRQLLK